MDAFFASVEQHDNPQYKGRPLIVGGNPKERGVVAACSYEARRFGVHSAMASAKAHSLCPEAVFVRPRHNRYREVSSEIMKIFLEVTPLVEPLSLDEAFLDVTENHLCEHSATRIANYLRQKIFHTTGLTASAGVSYNKFIAKVASDINKPNGITIIPPEKAAAFIGSLPIGKFFGVGRVTEKKMHRLGIFYGRNLYKWKRTDLQKHFGKAGGFFYSIARGIDTREVEPKRKRKSIGSETTLPRDIEGKEEILSVLDALCDKLGAVLQNKGISGQRITLKVRFADFTTITRSRTLHFPLAEAALLKQNISALLSAVEYRGKKIRLLGVTVGRLHSKDTPQENKPLQLLLPFMEYIGKQRPEQNRTQFSLDDP